MRPCGDPPAAAERRPLGTSLASTGHKGMRVAAPRRRAAARARPAAQLGREPGGSGSGTGGWPRRPPRRGGRRASDRLSRKNVPRQPRNPDPRNLYLRTYDEAPGRGGGSARMTDAKPGPNGKLAPPQTAKPAASILNPQACSLSGTRSRAAGSGVSRRRPLALQASAALC